MTSPTDIIAEDGTWSDGLREVRRLARLSFERHGLEDLHEEMRKWLRTGGILTEEEVEFWEEVHTHLLQRGYPVDLDIAIRAEELLATLKNYTMIALVPPMSERFQKRLGKLLLTALTIGRCREALRSHLQGQTPESAEWSAGLRARNVAYRAPPGERNTARILNEQFAATMRQKAPRYRHILKLMTNSYYRTSEGREVIEARRRWDLDRGKPTTWEPNVDRIRLLIEGRRPKKAGTRGRTRRVRGK